MPPFLCALRPRRRTLVRVGKTDSYAYGGARRAAAAAAVEFGLMSTTTARETAFAYSGKDGQRCTVFEIAVGRVDVGADIGFLSQYPGEREFLMQPLSCLEVPPRPLSPATPHLSPSYRDQLFLFFSPPSLSPSHPLSHKHIKSPLSLPPILSHINTLSQWRISSPST